MIQGLWLVIVFKLSHDKLCMQPIGYVESCFKDRFGTPRQPGLVPMATAFIRIEAQWQPSQSLEGLVEYSHLWVIFIFHRNTNQRFHAKVHPPRLEGKSVGVFATRSPHRPNPIGLSLVKIEKIESEGIWVSGQDIIDGSPVLDIKPYLPLVESKPQAIGAWTDKVSTKKFEFHWTSEALQELNRWESNEKSASLKNLVEQTLGLDPRPTLYKQADPGQYRDNHVVRLGRGDVFFAFKGDSVIEVQKIVYPIE